MSHVHHPSLTGYTPGQILHDGCSECEHRGKNLTSAPAHLDDDTFERAWERAARWQRHGLPADDRLSRAEKPLLEALWGIQCLLERRGVPIGTPPGRPGPLAGLGRAEG